MQFRAWLAKCVPRGTTDPSQPGWRANFLRDNATNIKHNCGSSCIPVKQLRNDDHFGSSGVQSYSDEDNPKEEGA